jgi:hypothetical protein
MSCNTPEQIRSRSRDSVDEFSPEPLPPFERVLLDVVESAKREPDAAAECALFARWPASLVRSACLTLAQRQDRSASILPDMSHFAAELYEYCANPAGLF